MNGIIFYNHQFLAANIPCIQANDRGLTLGDGIFETILSYDYKMPFFDHHWQRLVTSLNTLQIDLPSKYNKDYLINIINKLLNKNDVKPKVWQGIKIIVTRGTGSRSLEPATKHSYEVSFIITCFEVLQLQMQMKSLDLAVNNKVNQHNILNNIKSLNYLDKIIAKQTALAAGYDDTLLINLDGNVCEATTSNIFFILDNNKIITPKISDGILPGITRKFIIETLKKSDYEIIEDSINIHDLNSTQYTYKVLAAFMTNAIIGLNSVNVINKLNLNLNNHEIINWLYKELLAIYI